MKPARLIAEGRRLARPCVFLRPGRRGRVAATWHEYDEDEVQHTGYRCWLTIDARFVPGISDKVSGFISVYTDAKRTKGGRIEVHAKAPTRPGITLRATEESVLPPIDAVFAQGSAAIEDWLTKNDWSRDDRYNSNFRDRAVVEAYERVWFQEFPFFIKDAPYAVLGGWHLPGPDDDWYSLISEQLLVQTLRDSEPWVEAWRLRNGKFRVIQRVT